MLLLKSNPQKRGKENPGEDSEGDSESVEEGGGHKKKKEKKTKVLSIARIAHLQVLDLISNCS